MQNLETAEGCQWLKSWYVEQSLHGNGNICEREEYMRRGIVMRNSGEDQTCH